MPPLDAALFDYSLPPQLVAHTPAPRRDDSRLMIVHRGTRSLEHRTFRDLPEFLRAGDTLIRNNASVLPARLRAVRPTGGQVECFLLRPLGDELTWRCLVKPGRKLPIGAVFSDPGGAFSAEIVARDDDGAADVRFAPSTSETIPEIANRLGAVPLPPYIVRNDDSSAAADRERYQTVYADHSRQVAVAAPTAGLHFSPDLLAKLAAQRVRFADATLHVGLGTFKPIASTTIEEHRIHRERYELPAATQRVLFPPHSGRRIAVGTTAVRMLEDFLARHAAPISAEQTHFAEADLFIHPPRAFRGVDALITNFHQPRSTLLCLVAAFLSPGSTDGIAWWREIYADAIARKYRFFSYGDAMLIL